MKKILFLFLTVVLVAGCKKSFNVQPTYANPAIAATWAKNEPFYAPKGEVYIDSINVWRPFIGFAFTSASDPNKLGFLNPYNIGKGTNALNMRSLYTNERISSDSGYYNITIAKCFEFIPKTADSIHTGTVNVIPQKVRIFRIGGTYFDIGISGSGGSYNTLAGTFNIDIVFDETSIGGPAARLRKYRFRP
jgi:hypothetical protein